MKEITDILNAWRSCKAESCDAALATVVRVEGSGYRRPGARMLILGDGLTVGTISGGCLERDVIYRAGAVSASSKPALVRYDSISEEEAGPGASLGCGGTIDILIEPLSAQGNDDALRFLDWLWSRRAHGVIVTAIAQENTSVPIGWRMAMDDQGGELFSSPALPGFSPESFRAFATSQVHRHMTTDGWVDLFVEIVHPPLELFIFGAGADTLPVTALATSLGWRVNIVDLRAGSTATPRPFQADAVIRMSVQKLHELFIPKDAAAIVMNHNWNSDLATLTRLHDLPLKYLGILGPRKRTERLLSRIGATAPAAAHVCYPIGLDIGAQSPQEIALAIVAEITSILHGGSGGSLSERAGPIHARADEPGQVESCPVAAS